jgi:hypothetical protein
MPRRSKTKSKLSTSIQITHALLPVLNENIIICIPVAAIEQEQKTTLTMTQEDTMYTYNPKLSTPLESHMRSFQEENAWIDGSEHVSCYHPFDGGNVSDVSRKEMEKEVAQTISSMNVEESGVGQKQTCMWCCHTFKNAKVHLPLQRKKEEFTVYGTFCSVQCAAAYNFNDILEFGDTWERYSLLHSLYFDAQNETAIQLAPPRVALAMFGGDLDIEEFRGNASQATYTQSLAPIKYIKTYSTGSSQVLQNVKRGGVHRVKTALKTPFTFLEQRR